MAEKNFRLHEEFELSPYTMAIIPMPYGSRLYSKILDMEEEEAIVSPFKPFDIIKKSCRYYASSFSGRKEGTKELIGVTHKAPIVIDPLQSIYFFPTTSPIKEVCAWIAHENVLEYKRADNLSTEVVFRNKQSYTFPMSYSSFENQMLRTALLRTKMLQRSIESDPFSLFGYREWQMEALEKRKHYRAFR